MHKHQTVTVLVSDTTLGVELGDDDVRVIHRTTTNPCVEVSGSSAAAAFCSRAWTN
jgi:hypothetical protein